MTLSLKRSASALLLVLLAVIIPSTYGADREDPWDFLKEFTHVRGAVAKVDEDYVAALFHDRKKNLKALVLFPANCESHRCSLGDPVAYSVFDPRGLVVRFHEEPGESALLQRLMVSGSPLFRTA